MTTLLRPVPDDVPTVAAAAPAVTGPAGPSGPSRLLALAGPAAGAVGFAFGLPGSTAVLAQQLSHRDRTTGTGSAR